MQTYPTEIRTRIGASGRDTDGDRARLARRPRRGPRLPRRPGWPSPVLNTFRTDVFSANRANTSE